MEAIAGGRQRILLVMATGTGKTYTAFQIMWRFAIARELIAARARAGLSQADLAERMGTSQSTIARLESGCTLSSLRTLDRYARATGSRAVVRLKA